MDQEYLNEQDIINMMVDFLRDEHQFQYATIHKESLVNYILENVEVSNQESKWAVIDVAQGVLDALTEAGYLTITENGYEIYKYLDDEANVIIEYEDEIEEEKGI